MIKNTKENIYFIIYWFKRSNYKVKKRHREKKNTLGETKKKPVSFWDTVSLEDSVSSESTSEENCLSDLMEWIKKISFSAKMLSLNKKLKYFLKSKYTEENKITLKRTDISSNSLIYLMQFPYNVYLFFAWQNDSTVCLEE